jgi:hypothetical protein
MSPDGTGTDAVDVGGPVVLVVFAVELDGLAMAGNTGVAGSAAAGSSGVEPVLCFGDENGACALGAGGIAASASGPGVASFFSELVPSGVLGELAASAGGNDAAKTGPGSSGVGASEP